MRTNYNRATLNGIRFWSGCVSLIDGQIEETHTFEEAERVDFHHSLYFSPNACEKMDEGASAFFYIDRNGQIEAEWRNTVPDSIIRAIQTQIDITNSDYAKGRD